MKPLKILITLLTALGAVGMIAGALTYMLIAYTGRTEYIAFPIVCFAIACAAIIASGILGGYYNKKLREQRSNTNMYYDMPGNAGRPADPFAEFPDSSRRRDIDPFGFDTPSAPLPSGKADKFCTHCGAKRDPGDEYCPYCGHKYD